MKIVDHLKEEWLNADLAGTDKRSILEELCVSLVKPCGAGSPDELAEILLEREKMGSTGIGGGMAIPHGRLKRLRHFYITFGRSLKGVDFDSIDQKPCQLFFLVLAPENSAAENLNLLGRIARLGKDPSFKKRLMGAKNREELFQVISEEDQKY